MSLPNVYCEKIKDLFEDEYDTYLDCLKQKPFHGLRINTDKISVSDFLKINPFHLTQVPWCENGFYYGEEDTPSKHPFYYAGLYYLQEPSAMAPASYLPIEEGDYVLDACAAPGGKTTALANRLQGSGLLVSNDISASRQNATLKNIERFGLSNIYVTAMNLVDMAEYFPSFFDKILIDAPCSGEGMFRKDPSLITSWKEKGPLYYADVQKEIVQAALKMLKPGGMILYSTCTFSKEENEDTIAYLLNLDSSLKLIDLPNRYIGFDQGIGKGFEACARLYPHHIQGEGHFLALIQKEGEGTKENQIVQDKKSEIPMDAQEFLKHTTLDLKRMVRIKDKIVYMPKESIPTDKIRILRSGILVGTMKKERFTPSQHLAYALKKEMFDQTISFRQDDPRVISYLKGETIQIDEAKKGWVLVLLEDYPLGFGKCDGKIIKNKIDPAYRM